MKKLFLGAFLAAVFAGPAFGDDNWPMWRGPAMTGVSDSKNLPTRWSKENNVKWKARVPSWSGSSPVIWGDRIFVASPSEAGKGPNAPQKRGMGGARKPDGTDLLLLCYSKKDGKPLWRTKLTGGNHHMGYQNMSSPSPVTDGKMVWALTGTGILTGLTVDGKIVWQADLEKAYGKFGLGWGYGSSPLYHEGRIIVQVLHGNNTDDPSYLVAFAGKTGKVLWRVERPTDAKRESPDAFSTPVPMKVGNRTEILICGGDYLTSHDPRTGREIWRCGDMNLDKVGNYRGIGSPAVAGDLAVACIRGGPTVACRPGGRGNVTKSHMAWTSRTSWDVPTPVSDGKLLYVLHDRGFMSCYDARTGKARYERQRLPSGTYRSSPLLADGKIYVTNANARTTVLGIGPEFKILSENPLDDDYTLSSIAVSGSELFIRTSTHLYCISK